MLDWVDNPEPKDVPGVWARLIRLVASLVYIKPVLSLATSEPIVVDGATQVPHGVRRRTPRSAMVQIVGPATAATATVTAVDDRYIYLDSTAAVQVHLWVLV